LFSIPLAPNLIVDHVAELGAWRREDPEFFHEVAVKHTVGETRSAHFKGRHDSGADQLMEHRGLVHLNQE